MNRVGSHLEQSFRLWLRQEHLPAAVEQYRFHPTRKWRFDFAWPGRKIAVEVDGLVPGGRGGHQTIRGILRDAEKAEAALRAGWTVYRIPGQWVATKTRHVWRPKVIDTLRQLLESDRARGTLPTPAAGADRHSGNVPQSH